MIQIRSIKYNNELRSSQDLTYLIGCIGERITVTTEFYYEDITYRTEDNLITIEPELSAIDLNSNVGIITSDDGMAFKDTYVGDTIGVCLSGVFAFYTVTEKFDNGMIRTDYTGSTIELGLGDYIFNSTPFRGAKYAYNLLEVGNSYNSLVDGEYQQLVTVVDDCTVLVPWSLSFTGIQSYQIGSATMVGQGGAGGGGVSGQFAQQNYKIVHSTVITPFFLYNEYADLLLSKKPSYYDANKCLNYISQITFCKTLNNPNGTQSIQVPNALSNIGWFNENFNGGNTNYALSSLVLSEGATVIDTLKFDVDITVEATITNTVDSPFSSGNTKYIFGFNYLPETEDDYQNNGENLTTNFLFDSKLNTLGSGIANGTNYGTDMQVIKSVTSTYISATSMKVTATIRFGADAKAIMQQGDYSRYQMWLITEDHSNTAANSDKVNLLLQVGDVDLDLTTSTLITATSATFIQHPYTTAANGIVGTDLELYPVDDLVANLDFHINFTSHTSTEEIKIISVRNKIVLRDDLDVEADINLEDFTIATSAYPIIGGEAQAIAFSQDRVFKIPTEIRKTILLERDYTSDSGSDRYYTLQYPFMMRWEYWEALNGLTTAPTGIFDSTESLNGLNQFWYRFTTVASWHLYYDVVFTLEQNGVQFTQTVSTEIADSNTYESNAEWGNETIKSYDLSNNELVNGATKYINGYENVKIVASFEKLSGYVPLVTEIGMVIWIHVYEQNGISSIRRMSSFYENDSQSWFSSTDTSNKVVLAKTGAVYTGQCYIDYTKLPTNAQYTIYARLYEFYPDETKQFQGGDLFEFQGGTLYAFEH